MAAGWHILYWLNIKYSDHALCNEIRGDIWMCLFLQQESSTAIKGNSLICWLKKMWWLQETLKISLDLAFVLSDDEDEKAHQQAQQSRFSCGTVEKSKPVRKWAAIRAEHQSEWGSASVATRMNKSTLSPKLISLKLKFYYRRAWTSPW